jgi:hypothetical protein
MLLQSAKLSALLCLKFQKKAIEGLAGNVQNKMTKKRERKTALNRCG